MKKYYLILFVVILSVQKLDSQENKNDFNSIGFSFNHHFIEGGNFENVSAYYFFHINGIQNTISLSYIFNGSAKIDDSYEGWGGKKDEKTDISTLVGEGLMWRINNVIPVYPLDLYFEAGVFNLTTKYRHIRIKYLYRNDIYQGWEIDDVKNESQSKKKLAFLLGTGILYKWKNFTTNIGVNLLPLPVPVTPGGGIETKDQTLENGSLWSFSLGINFDFPSLKEIGSFLGIKNNSTSTTEKNNIPIPTFPPAINVTTKLDGAIEDGFLDATEQTNLSLKLTNIGKGSAYGLSVKLSPEKISGLTFPSEMFIGEVGVGETKEVSIPISASLDVESKEVSLMLTFSESNGFPPPPTKITFSTKAFTPPKLEVVDVGIDDANGNGRIEVGEVVKVTTRIQNTGAGKASDVSASVNIGENIFLTPDSKTNWQFVLLNSGEYKDISFSIFANQKATGVPVFVSITEKHKRFGVSNYLLPLELHKTIPKLEEVVVKGKMEDEMKRVELATGLSIDIEQNIPVTHQKNPDAVAVVIGISRYKNTDVPSVDYANRGATIMKKYLTDIFGYDERRIIFADNENASLGDFKRIFEEQLRNYIKPGKSDVFIYYNGHGAPDPETKETFFVPYDCNPAYAKSTGYPLKEFYNQLAKLPAKSITVVIDACFSGSSPKGALLKQVSPVFISVEEPIMAIENGLLFASSTGQQLSNWYPEKKHGLFTYYFLKALQGNADINNDKQLTVEEVEQYLLNNVPEQARYLNNREQTPQVVGKGKNRIMVNY
ncbi:MAG: caspase family protein [Bacteroidota bacterium]|nr:caspase family protein [Bacteroidota bacterium]